MDNKVVEETDMEEIVLDLYYSVVVFIIGLTIGSFLNVVIYRLPEGKSIATPPSHCPKCNSRLKPLDLIPVISWVLLKGKCRYCGAKIAIRYTLVELVTGILFVVTFQHFDMGLVSVVFMALVAVLIAIVFIDLDHQIIPDELNLILLVLFIISNLFFSYMPWKEAFLGAIAGFLPLFLIVLLTGGNGMGMGDVKLMFVLGLYLGLWPAVLTLFLSFIYGGVFGIVLLATKIKSRKDAIPFGPWIVLATFTTLFFGNEIIRWYFGLLS